MELEPLTFRLGHAVRTGSFDAALGVGVGNALIEQGYRTTDVIGPTVITLVSGFADDFTGTPGDWPDAAVVHQRVTALAGAVAQGFAHALRERALAEQEEIQRAALAAVRAAEAERRFTQARFRALFAQTAVGIGIVSGEGRVIDGNAAWGAMLGFSVAEMRGRPMSELVQPGGSLPALRRFNEVLAGVRDHFRLEITHEGRHGRSMELDLSVSRVQSEGDEPDFLVGIAIDVTERRKLQNRLWHEARHDPLTRLPNRTLFFERLDEWLIAVEDNGPVGLCYIDLDGFKSVNDGLGHEIGDRLLVRVAQRLSEAVTVSGTVLARLGGDEFGVIVRQANRTDLDRLAERILSVLADPITIDDRELTVSASVGVVDTSTAGAAADVLMRAADISLYRAKERGRGRWERHDPLSNARQVTRHTLATEMSAALAHGEFFLDYQPLVSLRDGAVRRVEALLRWQHPRLGLLHPDAFIGMAEENGYIVALGRWVLGSACKQAYDWHRRFPAAGLGVNVNVAVGQLYDPDLLLHVRSTLAETGLPPRLLHLELTESAVLGDAHGPLDALIGLADAGVSLAIDDFGTGYSNLVHLGRLPASELKIAGSFLESAPFGDMANRKILPAIISLAHSLGLSVTAEGVENARQADLLRSLDCDTAQGWFFGRPGPPEEIARLIAAADRVG
jgi:diguanylate cyclase (GGDEF)-like protein/PAS domain S-box-containing protein